MASARIERDGKVMNASELPAPGSVMAHEDNDANGSGDKPVWQVPTHRDMEHYKMKHTGGHKKLIIFNHKTYLPITKQKERTGTDADKKNMKAVFKMMGFDVDTWNDLSAADVIGTLQKEKETENEAYYRDCDCLVVAVTTHGHEDGLIWANDASYQVETIWSEFTADMCPALLGKPKIFIIQACRGNDASEGRQVKTETDGIKKQKNTMRYSIPLEADILTAYSTFIDKCAHRDTLNGTWYIQELCEELRKTGNSDDFLSILTKVNRRVALNYEHGSSKQMPMIQSTLTRKMYFGAIPETDSNGLDLNSSHKLDTILEMLQNFKVQPTRRTFDKPRSSPEWDEIKPTNESFKITESDDQIVKIAYGLKLLLADKKQVPEASDRDYGNTILSLVSAWSSLERNQQCFAYRRMINFLKTYGKDWETLKIMTLPALGPEK